MTSIHGDYDCAKFELLRSYGVARLGAGFRLGETRIGNTVEKTEPVHVASWTQNDGYTVGMNGELSIDPTTAIATLSTYEDDTITPTTTLRQDDILRASYDKVVIFTGNVVSAEFTAEEFPAAAGRGKRYVKKTRYLLRGRESMLIEAEISWGDLPAEPWLTRLQRWFTVDRSAVKASHTYQLNVTADPIAAGTSTRVDMLRAFSEATLLPVRLKITDPPDPAAIEVFDTAINWADAPMAADVTNADQWMTSATWASVSATAWEPKDVSVKHNDLRFTGGIGTYQATTPNKLGEIILGNSRIGGAGLIRTGFRAGNTVNVLGTVMAVAHLSQTFGAERYSADLEFAPRLNL